MSWSRSQHTLIKTSSRSKSLPSLSSLLLRLKSQSLSLYRLGKCLSSVLIIHCAIQRFTCCALRILVIGYGLVGKVLENLSPFNLSRSFLVLYQLLAFVPLADGCYRVHWVFGPCLLVDSGTRLIQSSCCKVLTLILAIECVARLTEIPSLLLICLLHFWVGRIWLSSLSNLRWFL